jgi:hypothetical protein
LKPDRAFLTGIIEGFYGKAWSHATRMAYAGYLAHVGLNTCLYCPKGDAYLRKQWRDDWPTAEWKRLRELAATYRQRNIFWGVGLSPYTLYQQYDAEQRKHLQRKVLILAELEAPLLAILFDDMPGGLDALAARQAEIVCDVTAWLPGVRVMVCPTYYSFDPVLERHFGKMPGAYWSQLGREMPAEVDIFWTGNRVCSESITRADIEQICAQVSRPVMLWDNYPVNDGAVRSNFLYLYKLNRREPLSGELLSGHLCNPMNQGLLSLPALIGLAELYQAGGGAGDWLEQTLGPLTWRQLGKDRDAFRELGLSGMGQARCRKLAELYRALPGPAAREVADWLLGEYRFDPACLTD